MIRFGNGVASVKTDEQGLARVPYKGIYNKDHPLLYAVHADRQLAAFVDIKGKGKPRQINIILQPACEVRGRLTSKQLAELGRELTFTMVYVMWNEEENRTPLRCVSDREFRFLMPPGHYKLLAYGTTDTVFTYPVVDIPMGTHELDVAIDIPASTLGRLHGRAAPELKKIKGWKNGGPVTLQSLKGRVVMLDFWGYWCGNCLAAMPDLMKLHDKYADKGLTIIAIHDDSTESIAEMDKKLVQTRKGYWRGRDLPFLVALDGGGRDSGTIAEYGIRSYPTTILIDKAGNIAELDFFAGDPESEKVLRKLLGISEDAPK